MEFEYYNNCTASICSTSMLTGEIEIPDTVTTPDMSVFILKKIKYESFAESSITKVVFPNNSSINSIGIKAFYQCTSLDSVHFSDSIKKIKQSAFMNCFQLETVHINKTSILERIDMFAFFSCYNLRSIIFPESIKQIGRHAFENCSMLHKIEFSPSSHIDIIYDSSFKYATNIEEVDLYSIVELEPAFYGCKSLKTMRFLSTSEPTILLPFIFYFVAIENLVLPYSLEYISDGTFYGMKSLNNLTINGENKKFKIANGSLYQVFPFSVLFHQRSCYRVFIREMTQYVGVAAFEFCRRIRKVFIPASVIEIKSKAFYHCSSLKIINFSKYSKLNCIKNNAFEKCVSLIKVHFPRTLTIIEELAFLNCKSLRGIYFPEDSKIEIIGRDTFVGCRDLVNAKMPFDKKNLVLSSLSFTQYLTDMEIDQLDLSPNPKKS